MKLVDNWRTLWKSLSVQLAFFGALLPELLQVLADNTALIPWFDGALKDSIRFAALMLIPLARVIKQKAVSG